MAKVKIIVDVGNPIEARAVDDWFARWRSRPAAVSEDQGCGCCVHIWEVDGPVDALHELPKEVVGHPGIEE